MSFCYRLGVKPGYRSKMKPWNAVTVKKILLLIVVNFHNELLF